MLCFICENTKRFFIFVRKYGIKDKVLFNLVKIYKYRREMKK